MVEVLEHCQVAPPPGTVVERSLQPTFYDLMWFNFPPVQNLLLYEFPYSINHFKENVTPNLKHSLSLSLQHFFPLAGKLVITIPSNNNSNKPEIRYLDGDSSVSLTLAVAQSSSYDFNNLIGNHTRNASEFYAFLPKLPPNITKKVLFKEDTGATTCTLIENLIPLFAIQVTLFPNVGICFGFTLNHLIADGCTFVHFMRSWALISKLGSDSCGLLSLPFYDRSVISDPNNGLQNIMLSQLDEYYYGNGPNGTLDEDFQTHTHTHTHTHQQLPINKVRATFLIPKSDAQKLKELVLTRLGQPTKKLCHVSTFTVTCAFLWVCWVKSDAAANPMEEEEEKGGVDVNELEYSFGCLVDCRNGRTHPPVPETYFGNCLVPCLASVKRGLLMGEEGFVIAAELIGEAIDKRIHNNNGEGLLEGADTWISLLRELNPERTLTVAGSPKFRIYDMDFGWGKPKKREVISIDGTGAISITECKNSEGGLEFGLSLPENRMNAFSSIFAHGLEIICKHSKGDIEHCDQKKDIC